ncbi:MAG: hypothetical protein ABS52_10200 [Gemmatimonadetes bacterium SCN 70-22]|nr:MAG: hypothetical protein ABS52_10200 [Gemmatimonadetes bacterium SCN 70-22]
MPDSLNPRRLFMGAARKYLFDAIESPSAEARPPAVDEAPRLTPHAIQRTRMSRTRDRILANLDDMYREAFERAKATGDESQMASLDFAYRREQLYFEILLDVRDALERR